MSPELKVRTRRRRILIISVAIACAIWFISPWLYLGGVQVVAAEVRTTPRPGAARPKQLVTPDWIAIRFTTSRDLEAYRSRWRLPFIQAEISACRSDSAGTNDEVVTQRAEYFADYGRVRALGRVSNGAGQRYAYEVIFDDVLSNVGEDHRLKSVTASTVPGGLCFRLHGAMLGSGSVRSSIIPLALTKAEQR